MSDKNDASLAVAKPQANKPSLVKPRKPKSKAKAAQPPTQVAQSPTKTLVQVAVTAADAELETAKRAYQDRKQENVVDLFDFIREEQSATATDVEDAVLGFHGLTRDDLYELPQPAEGD
ncbi:hypothetical protein Lepto7375DRAFT_7395 [Leptolyngbya sp. PCC 7375]|nr:hypothetical protein Lepto7375DRAFT_7395 [Leptolyngbya sp. PCC 7375]